MTPDFLVIGAGVAGLQAAIDLSDAGEVLVVAKDSLWESSSAYAQGGVAVVISDDDKVSLHEQDTLAAGDGLCDPVAVQALVQQGPDAIQRLLEWGVEFDRDGMRLALGREGAHSRNRILHAHGDSTGREIARTLSQKAASIPSIQIRSFTAITDLLVENGAVGGAVFFDEASGRLTRIHARAVLLATGGMGRIFRDTTNPDVATGDGVAVAWRAGAELSDLEFVQFHPTALMIPGAPRFLLSEAMRGEGAYLRNIKGERFMERYSPMLELAPRDVVARAIVAESEACGTDHVLLDLTHLDGEFIATRFPTIYATCKSFGVDLAVEPAPVTPAAHYAMGGVRSGLSGMTSLERLYVAGEAACTGVHGANRLASNSLLEGLVFGTLAASAMKRWAHATPVKGEAPEELSFPEWETMALRTLAWDNCGLLRDRGRLESLLERLDQVHSIKKSHPVRSDFELRNMKVVLELIARSALAREESRGAHHRLDFPEKREEFRRHSLVYRQAGPFNPVLFV
ncbi:MAG: L-aspartate oxidase [Bryobacterales bacterium]|nr:L-aspartate oxidase [Bryobacterales bacterium]